MKNLLTLLLLFSAVCFTSCLDDDDPKDKSWTVEATVASETEEATLTNYPLTHEYLKVKFDGDTEWSRMTLSEISGFNFEDGNEYRLKIKVTELANPPADGGSIIYELDKVLSKTKKDQNIQQVQRFYIGDVNIRITESKMTDEEKKAIENDIMKDYPKPTYRTFKFIFTDKEKTKGNFILYTNNKKQTGTFEKESQEYIININDEVHTYIIMKVQKALGGESGVNYSFTEDLTEKYKTEYPNLVQLLVQHVIYSAY